MRHIPKDRLFPLANCGECHLVMIHRNGKRGQPCEPSQMIEGGKVHIELNSSTVTLSPASVIAVQDGAGSRVLCRSGILWVTQEGELKDSIVRAGEVLTLRKPGRTVIGALEAASLTLTGPEP